MDIGGSVTNTVPYIETVRSLHQTVTALRTALEESKKEILLLKNKVWPIDSIEQSLTALAIENHALRRKLLENNVDAELPLKEENNSDKIKTDNFNFDPTSSFLNLEEPIQEKKVHFDEDVASSTVERNIHSIPVSCHEPTSDVILKPEIQKSKQDFGDEAEVENPLKLSQKNEFSENELKTDSQQSLTNIGVGQGEQPTQFDIESCIANKTQNLNEVTKVCLTKPKSKSTDSKKAKKEKRSSKKQLKIPKSLSKTSKNRIRASVQIKAKTYDAKKNPKTLDSLTILKTPLSELKFSKTTHFFNLNGEVSCEITSGLSNMSENNYSSIDNSFEREQDAKSSNDNEDKGETEQEPEVDDIELIFTTDDTKESDFKGQLVSIDSVERENNVKLLAPEHDQSVDISDRELDDDVFDGSFDHDNQDCNALQVFQLERDNSQLYNSKSDNSINQEERSLRSYYSYQDSSFENKSMEKDESFDRFEERIRIVETDISKVGITEVDYAGIRRNTCPNPLQYRPLLHREAISKGLNVKKSRPILAHSNAVRRESGAQTDISAIPGSAWRSESSLANKAHLGDNFTTLPSKFPLPGSRLKLSEKTTVEARRVLLSDIGFTSMVPELSRSADHLCPALKPPVTTYGQFLRTPELYSPAYTSQRFTWTTTTATPSDGSQSHSRYSMNPLTPPVQTRRCSAPVSPSRKGALKSGASRVRFANGSLPELRGDWTQMTADSGDSTDSLVEEAENYLRRSIDCILGTSKGRESDTKRYILRRASAPESAGDNTPPQGWQPFLPRQPRDLKPDHWVKVITPEGKVKGGRVRYIGPVATQVDQFVGVQLAVPEGHSDGTYNTRRYFQCEPYHGIFVPFKKVIMGWRP